MTNVIKLASRISKDAANPDRRAVVNDRFRTSLSMSDDVILSEYVESLDKRILKSIFNELKTASYRKISFTVPEILTNPFLSAQRRQISEAMHSEGIVYAGNPTEYFYWSIRETRNRLKLYLFTAEEILLNYQAQ